MRGRSFVWITSALAVGLAVHTAVNLRSLRRLAADAPDVVESVSVLVPARNEERHVAATVRSLLEQTGLASFEVIVLDDGSRDGTAAALERIADDRVRVVRADDVNPPEGWLGKPWACARLAEQARGSVLVFADADVHFEPAAVRAAIHELRTGEFAMVSPFPQQVADTWLERLVQPLVWWAWAATLPLSWAQASTRPSLSAANGQFLVFDADAYRAAGGHAAVRGEVIEDIALMRAVRAAGLRTSPLDAAALASCRMYTSTGEVIDGYAKSLWSGFGGPVGSLIVCAALTAIYVVPPVALVLGRGVRPVALAGTAAGSISRALVARRSGDRVWPDAFVQPASILAFVALNAVSWRRKRNGTALWKGRAVSSSLSG